jgi:MOSC domain-containing protein YiiM
MAVSVVERGMVHRINVKPQTRGERGLPKRPVESVLVTKRGLTGDFNLYRQEKLLGDPNSAVLLLPLETILQLNSEGWPIRAGDLGENFTTAGVPYKRFSPGKAFRLGGAIVEVSRACDPCNNLYLLPYVGTSKGPNFIKIMLGRRGWYARVRKEGEVRRGDVIEEVQPTVTWSR